MDAYLIDWVHLLLRWAHVITAIAWIGSSFYFVFLDNSLTAAQPPDLKDQGVDGKFGRCTAAASTTAEVPRRAEAVCPGTCTGSIGKSYATWITGFALFSALPVQRGHASCRQEHVRLVPGCGDRRVAGFLVVFWIVYDAICRTFGQRATAT